MRRFILSMKTITSRYSIAIIILIALFGLLIDGPNFKDKGFEREYKIIKFISYSYIAIGIIFFIILRIG